MRKKLAKIVVFCIEILIKLLPQSPNITILLWLN